jgi:preprotein translocase subunit SecG
METFFAGLLTVLIVINSLLLILLVLIQLPKKDAGAGLAFGGGAADALFGAGSGNTLTRITKYAIIAFFLLVITLGYVYEHLHRPDVKAFENAMQQQPQSTATPPTTPASTPAPMAASNATSTAAPMPAPVSAPAAAGTNTPAK